MPDGEFKFGDRNYTLNRNNMIIKLKKKLHEKKEEWCFNLRTDMTEALEC